MSDLTIKKRSCLSERKVLVTKIKEENESTYLGGI